MPIHVQGANEHNLQGIDVEFGDGLTVVTGVSGSGKTSLVFDTLYHEARRRFLEVFALGSPNLGCSRPGYLGSNLRVVSLLWMVPAERLAANMPGG